MPPQLVPASRTNDNEISSVHDAHALFQLARTGRIRIIRQHLTAEEKSAIGAGHVYIYDARKIERWTDNRLWSKAYSTKAGWLIYKEVEYIAAGDQRIKRRKQDGLCKKILCDVHENSALRLVYYTDRILSSDMEDNYGTSFYTDSYSGHESGSSSNAGSNNGGDSSNGSAGFDSASATSTSSFFANGPFAPMSANNVKMDNIHAVVPEVDLSIGSNSTSPSHSAFGSPATSRTNSLPGPSVSYDELLEMRRRLHAVQRTMLQQSTPTFPSVNFTPAPTTGLRSSSLNNFGGNNNASASLWGNPMEFDPTIFARDTQLLLLQQHQQSQRAHFRQGDFETAAVVPELPLHHHQQQQQQQQQQQHQPLMNSSSFTDTSSSLESDASFLSGFPYDTDSRFTTSYEPLLFGPTADAKHAHRFNDVMWEGNSGWLFSNHGFADTAASLPLSD